MKKYDLCVKSGTYTDRNGNETLTCTGHPLCKSSSTWSTGTSSKSPSTPLRLSARSVNLGLSSGLFVTRKFTKFCPKAHNINDSLILSGYHFLFIQSLIHDTDTLGHALKFYPQMEYRGRRKLHRFGIGPFCRFHITPLEVAGVYLLVSDDQILYIGETCNLNHRFNNRCYGSYGFITPTACYKGGQSTNCKINMLVLQQFEMKQPLMDNLFRQSGLMRPKWDEQHGSRTYGAMTISKALIAGEGYIRINEYKSFMMTSEKSDTVFEAQGETEKPKTLIESDKILFMKLTNVYSYVESVEEGVTLDSDLTRFQQYQDRKTGYSNIDAKMSLILACMY